MKATTLKLKLKSHAQDRLENENSRKVKTRAHPPLGPELLLWASWKQVADLDSLHMGQPPKRGTVGRREDNVSRKADRKHPGKKEWPPSTLPHSVGLFSKVVEPILLPLAWVRTPVATLSALDTVDLDFF